MIFWNIYAKTYDKATNNFSAYRELMSIVVEKLSIKDNDKILDLGCGTGNLEHLIKKNDNNFSLLGLDVSEAMLAFAKNKVNDSRILFKMHNLNLDLDVKDNTIDKVVMIHSLYTISDLNKMLIEIKRVLKPNGEFIVVNPLKNANMKIMMKYEEAKIGKFRLYLKIIRLLPAMIFNKIISGRAKKNQYHFLTKEEYSDLFSRNGYNLVESFGVYAGQSLFMHFTVND